MKIMLVAICCIIMAFMWLQLWQLIIFISEGFLSANFAGGENLYRAALPDLSASRLSDSLPNFFWHLPFYYDTQWVWSKLSHSVCNILTACKILKSLFFFASWSIYFNTTYIWVFIGVNWVKTTIFSKKETHPDQVT